MSTPRRPTLAQVASRAQVSVTTASAALRGLPGVNEQTRASVVAVARQIGYRTDSQAAGLRSGRTGMVGMVLETAALDDDPDNAKLFYPRLINGLASELTAAGMGLSLVARAHADLLARLPIDAALVQAARPAEVIDSLPFGMPVVVGIGPVAGAAAVVGHDYDAIAAECVGLLSANGAQGICFIVRPNDLPVIQLIAARFAAAAEVAGADFLVVDGVDPMAAAASRGAVDAVVSPGAGPARIMEVLKAAGLSVPGDVLVLSLGEDDLASTLELSVSSLSFLGRDSGHLVGQVLVAGVRSGEFASTALPYRLDARASTDRRGSR